MQGTPEEPFFFLKYLVTSEHSRDIFFLSRTSLATPLGI